MADYCTHFSCPLDVGTPDNAARTLDLTISFPKKSGGATFRSLPALDPARARRHSYRIATTTPAIGVLIQFIETLRRHVQSHTGRWGFNTPFTTRGVRLDGFGGGAHVLDLATGETVDFGSTPMAGLPRRYPMMESGHEHPRSRSAKFQTLLRAARRATILRSWNASTPKPA